MKKITEMLKQAGEFRDRAWRLYKSDFTSKEVAPLKEAASKLEQEAAALATGKKPASATFEQKQPERQGVVTFSAKDNPKDKPTPKNGQFHYVPDADGQVTRVSKETFAALTGGVQMTPADAMELAQTLGAACARCFEEGKLQGYAEGLKHATAAFTGTSKPAPSGQGRIASNLGRALANSTNPLDREILARLQERGQA